MRDLSWGMQPESSVDDNAIGQPAQTARTDEGPLVADQVGGEAELALWRSFLRAHAEITRRLAADLVRSHELDLAEYDVLVQLVEAPGRQLRMTDLAELVLLSRSGVTRLVTRLEADGLVARMRCPSDARGVNAIITESGVNLLRRATPDHLDGVARYFSQVIPSADKTTMAHALAALLADTRYGARLAQT